MPRKYAFLFFVLIGIAAVYYWFRGTMYIDPDLGFHIRMGQLILTKGIPAVDTFSYTMPSYPVVDHEWLTDVLIVSLLSIVGNAGLSAIFTIIALGALISQWITLRRHEKQVALIPFFLTIMILAIFFGVRPQVISWFLFSIMLVIVRDFERFRKWRWWLPVVFLGWANLHGGFAIGIVTFLAACIYWIFKRKCSILSGSGVFLLSIAATFITPYGPRIWWEVWMSMTDGSLRWVIQEWMPAIFVPYFSLWVFFILSVFFTVRYIKKFTLLDIVLYFGLLAGALSSVRHFPLWTLAALPMIMQGLTFFHKEASAIQYGATRFGKAMKGFFVIVCILGLADLSTNTLVMLKFQAAYPSGAINFLRLHTPAGQIFSLYDWGGYLDWRLPQKKVFIDGRMPSWRWKANIPGESNYAFDDYQKFLKGKLSFQAITSRYRISTLLLPENRKNNNRNWLSNWLDRLDYFAKKSLYKADEGVNFYKTAEKAGWVIVYKDKNAVIYQDRTYEQSH